MQPKQLVRSYLQVQRRKRKRSIQVLVVVQVLNGAQTMMILFGQGLLHQLFTK